MAAITISDTYFETLGITLKSGRHFKSNLPADYASVILNEAAVKQLNLSNPVGQTITWYENQQATIVGVVQDAIIGSPYEPVEPMLFTPAGFWVSVLYRLAPEVNTQDAITQLAAIFDKYNPSYPFEYQFVDEAYADKFQQEVIIGQLAGLFVGLAILVSCLGLFGLAAYMAEQRRKEVGIRKVLGATVAQIWLLLSKEFLLLVLISCLIAAPIALYCLQRWLQAYTYRIHLEPGVFVLAGGLALLIAILTISFQAIKAGRAQPVDSLRVE